EQISILPPSLELLRRVETELAAIEKLHDEAAVRRRLAALNFEIAKVNATALEGPPTRLGTLDVEKLVAKWRRTRSANPAVAAMEKSSGCIGLRETKDDLSSHRLNVWFRSGSAIPGASLASCSMSGRARWKPISAVMADIHSLNPH